MTQRFVICDHGVIEASLVPEALLGRPGFCPQGVYETILLKNGEPVDWIEHWSRLQNGCAYLGIPVEPDTQIGSFSQITRLVEKNQLAAGLVRLRIQVFQEYQVTKAGGRFRILAALWPVIQAHPASFTIMLSELLRQHHDVSYNHKLMGRSYVEKEFDRANALNCNDVVFLNDRKELCEGVYSNLWLITGDTIATPPISSPCLPGITRSKILTVCRHLGISVSETSPLSVDDLIYADGAFLTSSIRGIQQIYIVKDRIDFPHSERTRMLCTLLANSLESV